MTNTKLEARRQRLFGHLDAEVNAEVAEIAQVATTVMDDIMAADEERGFPAEQPQDPEQAADTLAAEDEELARIVGDTHLDEVLI